VIQLVGTTWDHPRGWGGVRAAAEAFRAERPDVHVTWDVRTLQAFADQSIESLARRYDLLVLDHPAIGEAVARGVLVPLDGHLDVAFLEDQARSSVGRGYESYSWQGHQWALAIDAAAQVAAFRPELLERANATVPRTWEGVRVQTRALRRLGLAVAMPAIPVDAICAFLGTCRSLGEDPCVGPDAVVGRDVGREALGLLRDVVANAHPGSFEWNPPTVLDRMANTDQVAYTPLAFGYANFGRPGFGRHALRFAPGPGASGAAGDGGVPSGTLGGAGLAVSASTAHTETACAYAAFTASAEVQRTVYVEGGGQPGHRAAWLDPAVNEATGGAFGDALDALDAAYLRPRYDGFLSFQDQAGDLVHRFLRTGEGLEGVLDDVDASYRASLVSRAEADR
jgi:multiple sugar transport system substrate-binding protein